MAKTLAEQLKDEVEAAYVATTGDATVLFQFGALTTAEHEQDRRVCFVRRRGRLLPPLKSGGAWLRSGTTVSSARYDKVEDVEMHIYDEDSGELELLHEALVVVVSNLVFASVTPEGDYVWQTEEVARNMNGVHKIVQPLQIRWAVPDEVQQLTVVDSLLFTAQLGAGEFSNEFSREFKRVGGDPA